MIQLLLILLVINFISDQMLQPKQVLQNKSDSTVFMILHVIIWAIPMALFALILMVKFNSFWPIQWLWCVIPMHLLIEWPLSRYTSMLIHNKNNILAVKIIHLEKLLLNVVLLILFLHFAS